MLSRSYAIALAKMLRDSPGNVDTERVADVISQWSVSLRRPGPWKEPTTFRPLGLHSCKWNSGPELRAGSSCAEMCTLSATAAQSAAAATS